MNGSKKRWITMFASILSFGIFGSSFVCAVDNHLTRSSLRGLKGVYVTVENLDPVVEKQGLSRQRIERDVTERLQLAGIRLLSTDEWYIEEGSPYLYVSANVLKLPDTREYIYSIHVELRQKVYPVRIPVEIPGATTWSLGGIIGITGNLNKIRTSVRGQIDQFVDAYRAVNARY